MLARSVVLSSTISRRLRCGARRSAFDAVERVLELAAWWRASPDRRTRRARGRAGVPPPPDSICTGMCRVAGSSLRCVQHGPAEHVRQEHVER